MAGRFLVLVMLGAVGWLALPGNAGAEFANPMDKVHVVDFPDCCPRPAWWDEVEMGTRIGTMDEFLAVWQDQALTDQQRAKALFRAIEDFRLTDDDITAAAVNYFYWVDGSYSQIRELYEFGVARYIDYDRPRVGYGGEVGDMSAGMVNNLAKLYMADGEPERAVPLLRYILNVREAEVNDHILETAAVHLGDALSRLGRGPEAIEVLLAARRDYDGDWEKRLDDQLAKVRGTMGWSYYLHDQRQTRLLLAAFLFALLAVYVLRRQRRRRG
jgi:tetratricopeptide (TPR) repeat protein